MKSYIRVTQTELMHLLRSPFKMISILLFVIAIIFGSQNGYQLFKTHNKQIISISSNNTNSIEDMLLTYQGIENGTLEKPRRDPTIPYWAIWNVPSYAFKHPSPMMTFSLGQAEQYGYYKRVTNWSTTYDSDLAEEIANPERLAIGTLDFNFVFTYLSPILLIILLFNIGGLEKDLKFDNLIYSSKISKEGWILARFLFYYLLVIALIFILTIPYALIAGVFQNHIVQYVNLFLLILLYLVLWFTIFYFISLSGKGSSDQALKMISIWMVLCIIIPGTVHQITSLKYPTNYMTDHLDVSRELSNNIFNLPEEDIKKGLLEEYPFLKNTQHASDTSMNVATINRSVSGLINSLNKNVSISIEFSSKKKNKFIKSFSKMNPVTTFQNEMNAIAETDFYAYKDYRSRIQDMIDKKIELILEDTWNNVTVDKNRYAEYVKNFE
mgnify:FL=1